MTAAWCYTAHRRLIIVAILFRLSDEDQDAAKVDVTEATTDPTTYKYPGNPMITFVDLPGIGTPKFPDLQTYCEKVGLEKYDAFLIFTATRFTNFDLDLAKKVKSMGKSFFLICTKIDVDLMQKKGKASINEDAVLQKIRRDCMVNTKDLISGEEDIFLIGNYDKDKWDLDRLVEAIGKALPILQRQSLVLSLSNVTRGCLRRKAMFLKGKNTYKSASIMLLLHDFFLLFLSLHPMYNAFQVASKRGR